MDDVEDHLAGLTIKDVEEDAEVLLTSSQSGSGNFLVNCFVDSFLTTSVVNFKAMRAMLANVWHPIGGITIIDLLERRYLFRLYHKVDSDRLEASGTWNFNSHLLVWRRLFDGMTPRLFL